MRSPENNRANGIRLYHPAYRPPDQSRKISRGGGKHIRRRSSGKRFDSFGRQGETAPPLKSRPAKG